MKSAERLHALDERVRVESGADLFVDECDRRDATRAETINNFERELVIGRGFTGRNTNSVLKRIQIFAGTAHVTGRAVANAHQIPPAPRQMKLRIERGDTV